MKFIKTQVKKEERKKQKKNRKHNSDTIFLNFIKLNDILKISIIHFHLFLSLPPDLLLP